MKRQSKRTALNTVNPISFPFNMPTPQVTFPFGQPSIHFWHWKHSPCTILVFASLNSIFAGQLLVHLLHPFIQLSLFLSREKNGKIGSKEKIAPIGQKETTEEAFYECHSNHKKNQYRNSDFISRKPEVSCMNHGKYIPWTCSSCISIDAKEARKHNPCK